ncbi:MAG: hypothetical protein HYZ45_03540 [Burkholderiales bacterium]|nr:hypothetical protein [Burkholderiales bacterium]
MKLNKLPQQHQGLPRHLSRQNTASLLRHSVLLALPALSALIANPALAADSAASASNQLPTPAATTAPAATSTTTTTQSVIIRETKSSESERRHDTSARVVIDHAELTRFGDQALTDALKRIPGITITTAPGAYI